MDEAKARELLSVTADGGLSARQWTQWTSWSPGESEIGLDGCYTADELEAMAWWMRNKGGG